MSKLFMINIESDYENFINNNLAFKITQVGKEIPKISKNYWSVETHYRENFKGRIKQFAIRLPYDKSNIEYVKIISENDSSDHINLSYYEEKDLWFDANIFKEYNNHVFLNKGIGVTESGFIKIYVKVRNLETIILKIDFLPSSLSKKDYEIILAELFSIHSSLVHDKGSSVNMSIVKASHISSLEDSFTSMEKLLKDIDKNPYMELRKEMISKKINTKWNLKAQFESYINPGKTKYKHKVNVKSYMNYENLILKQLLLDFKDYLYILKIFLENEINNRYLNELKTNQNRLKLLSDLSEDDFKSFFTINSYIDAQNKSSDYYNYLKKYNNKSYYNIDVNLSINGDNLNYSFWKGIPKLDYTYNLKSTSKSLIINSISYRSYNNIQGYFAIKSSDLISNLLFEKAIQLSSYSPVSSTILISGITKKTKKNLISKFKNTGLYNYNVELIFINNIYINGKLISINSEEEFQNLYKSFYSKLSQLRKKESFESKREKEKTINSIKRNYEDIREQINSSQGKFDKLIELEERVERILDLKTFKNINIKRRIPIKLTNILIHEPRYRKVFNFLKSIEEDIGISFDTISKNKIQVKKLHNIYEVWILYKIIYLLTREMGWSLKNDKMIEKSLKSYLFENDGLENFKASLFLNEFSIDLYYEPKINTINNKFLTPDYVLKLKRFNEDLGLIILDAKYRNYRDMGIGYWKKDIAEVAIDKYGQLKSKDPQWNIPILNSSIIHSDDLINLEDDYDFLPYLPLYEEDISLKEKFKYSSITLTPSNVYMFKNYFRMIFEYLLDYYQVCWNCGGFDNIELHELKTRGGNIKYHIECKSCNEFWVKSHCTENTDHKIIKHNLNYLLNNKEDNPWNIICPVCLDKL